MASRSPSAMRRVAKRDRGVPKSCWCPGRAESSGGWTGSEVVKLRVVVLLSGGLDSTALLAWLLERGHTPVALTLRYGSRHMVAETAAARLVVEHFGVPHLVRDLPAGLFQGSALIDAPLPLGRSPAEMAAAGVAPSYVPLRNTVFLAVAGAIAEGMGAGGVAFAAHREDHVGYPDCRPEYARTMAHALRLGSRAGLELLAPFIEWRKADIVEWAVSRDAPLHLTHTCYQGARPACGVCDACALRLAAFAGAGLPDPIPYAAGQPAPATPPGS